MSEGTLGTASNIALSLQQAGEKESKGQSFQVREGGKQPLKWPVTMPCPPLNIHNFVQSPLLEGGLVYWLAPNEQSTEKGMECHLCN